MVRLSLRTPQLTTDPSTAMSHSSGPDNYNDCSISCRNRRFMLHVPNFTAGGLWDSSGCVPWCPLTPPTLEYTTGSGAVRLSIGHFECRSCDQRRPGFCYRANKKIPMHRSPRVITCIYVDVCIY